MSLLGIGTVVLSAATATGAGSPVAFWPRNLPVNVGRYPHRSFQCVLTGSGSVSASGKVQGSNDGTYWNDIGTFSLSGTASDNASFATDAPYVYVRGYVDSISGTSAALTITMAV